MSDGSPTSRNGDLLAELASRTQNQHLLELKQLLTTESTSVPDSSASRYKRAFLQAEANRDQAEAKGAELEKLVEDDQAGYRPASEIAPLYGFSLSRFSKFLAGTPETEIRRKRPVSNRLFVHAGDFIRYFHTHTNDPKIVSVLKKRLVSAPLSKS